MKLHTMLKQGREAKGLTLRDLEAITNISNPLLSQIETGHIKEPAFRKVVKLGIVLGIPLKKLAEAD